MRIICWNDFTETAQHSASVAGQLADRIGDTVLMLPNEESCSDFSATEWAGAGSQAADRSRHEHAETGDARFGHGGIGTIARPAFGLAVPPDGTRLIVAPAPRGDAPGDWPQASAAEQIALHAPVPTLIVRAAPLLETWLAGDRPLRVLVAHNLTAAADAALRFLEHLRRVGPLEITVVHVHRPSGQPAGRGSERQPPLAGRNQLERELKARVERILGLRPVEAIVVPAPIRRDNVILELASAAHVDLVVAGTHQRHGLDRLAHPLSVSRTLLRFAPANVLLVPLAGQPDARTVGIRRVLVATDLAGSSSEAVFRAYSLLPHGGTIRLLHVVHPRALPGGEFAHGIGVGPQQARDSHQALVQAATEQLRELVVGEEDAPGVTTETVVVEHAQVAAAIAEEAERFDADVICLTAAKSHSMLDRLFPSVPDAVRSRTRRALLLVQPPSP